ncbi:piggyBac transposable element-derived protein 3-like [Euwallacea similis]|uniref:piggyBac transposable element-derived protein 3-like n=1 Tax=Euwallacea similis TaxID=1736056 RepID=UPI00344BD93C
MSFSKYFTQKELEAALEEIVTDLQNNDESQHIDAVYIPPDVDTLTDEEDINYENNLQEFEEPTDIVGTFELHLPEYTNQSCTNQSCTLLTNEAQWDSSDDETLESKRRRLLSANERLASTVKWKKGQIEYTHAPISDEFQSREKLKNRLSGKTLLEIFFMFFDDEVIDLVLNFSVKYAQDNNRHEFLLSKNEFLNFIGILLFSGYHSLPHIQHYWSTDEDKGINLIKKCMSRNRFQFIKQNLHLSNNNLLDKNDKFAKVRPFFNAINQKNIQFGIFSHNLSIDEQMVPYFGRHTCKMFIKGKPVRFGFKLWCLCSSDGYLFYSLPYSGAQNQTHSSLGLGGDVVMSLLSVVDKPVNHQIFFDNFFSSFKLLVHLKNNGYFATGTIRENRTNKCPIENSKSFGKKVRGSYISAYESESKVSIVRWHDNSVVTVASNVYSVDPVQNVKRYSRKQRKDIYIPQPYVIAQYNEYMGGVDLHDNGIANYRCQVFGKKWWWPLFCNSLDSLVVNAWKLYNVVNEKKISQVDFKSYVALRLLKTDKTIIQRNLALPIDELRYDNKGHLIIPHTNKVRRRCRICHSHTIYICNKCNVHLHNSCFAQYHQK